VAASSGKETIYIDVDDEITGVIEKVHSSKEKIVALVLPKRATVLQSIVNMKLLKRTADDTKKHIVLITSEPGLLPLAGAVGVHVAKTLQSKPAIPAAPSLSDAPIDVSEDAGDVPLDGSKPVGELSHLPDDDETIEIDNQDDAPVAAAAAGTVAKKARSDRKLKIPNFNSFRKKLLLGGVLLVLLIAGWVFGALVLPKARIVIKTNTSTLNVNLAMTADTAAKTVDSGKKVVPAVKKEYKSTDSEKITSTGQKDTGAKAAGTVSLQNCSSSASSITIPAGTGVSASNLTFITQEAVTLPATTLNGLLQCTTPSKDVSVIAQNSGDKHNLAAGQNFTVQGYSKVSGSNAAAMAGGTSKIVKVVAPADIDSAKQKITERGNTAVVDQVKKQLEADGYYALGETLIGGEPAVTNTPNVGDEAESVTVNAVTTYTMLGVKQDDLKQLLEADITKQIDTGKQTIQDNGLGKATVRVQDKSAAQARFTVDVTATAGPQLDANAIKDAIAGKKRGQAQEIISQRPGIKDVEVKLSPFWVSSVPKKTSKITVVFESANGSN
jgi:hypothetical protein